MLHNWRATAAASTATSAERAAEGAGASGGGAKARSAPSALDDDARRDLPSSAGSSAGFSHGRPASEPLAAVRSSAHGATSFASLGEVTRLASEESGGPSALMGGASPIPLRWFSSGSRASSSASAEASAPVAWTQAGAFEDQGPSWGGSARRGASAGEGDTVGDHGHAAIAVAQLFTADWLWAGFVDACGAVANDVVAGLSALDDVEARMDELHRASRARVARFAGDEPDRSAATATHLANASEPARFSSPRHPAAKAVDLSACFLSEPAFVVAAGADENQAENRAT